MSSIDNRVVKMAFDNEEFEKKAGTTLDTLNKLKGSLDFSGAAKGMEEIEKSASGVDFSALAEGVQALQDRFSVMGEFIHNVFMNIVNSAVEAGRQIADALVLDPLKEGFSEYELQMNSVQTIMASTGESVDTINGYLDELNTYADKTIYSFSDMTQNIGKFTNAGVSLDDAVKAIQGISNEAAVSGANTQEASRAMYNFAQALSAGYVKLIDWKSIEYANMATVEFKQGLIETAVAMGTLVKVGDQYQSTTTNAKGEVSDLFDATSNFNDSLQSQWMSTEVLTQALKNYSTDVREMSEEEKAAYEEQLRGIGYTEDQIAAIEELGIKAFDSAQDVKTFTQLIGTLKEALGSGWTKSWQYIVGDFEDAKAFWTEVNNVLSGYINATAEARNGLLKAWSEGGGRAALIDSLRNAFDALLSVLTPIKKAWDSIFPSVKAEELIQYTNNLKSFTEGLKLNAVQQTTLGIAAGFVFKALRSGFEAIKNLGGTVIDILGAIGRGITGAFSLEDVGNVASLVEQFKQFTEAIKPSEKALEAIERVTNGVVSVFGALISVASNVASTVFGALGNVFNDILPDGESFLDLLIIIGNSLNEFAKGLEGLFSFDSMSEVFNNLATSLVNLWNAAKEFLNLDGVIEWFKNIFSVTEGVKPSIDLLGTIGNILGSLSKAFADFTASIDPSKLDIGKILNLAANAALFKKIYDIFTNINNKLKEDPPKTWLESLKNTFESVLNGVGDLLKTFKDSILDVVDAIEKNVKADVFQKVAISFAVLVGSLWVLSTIDTGKLASSIAALTALMIEVGVLMKAISGLNVVNLRGVSTVSNAMIKMAASIFILALAVKMLASMEPEQISAGLLAVTILLGEMAAVAKSFSNMDKNLSKGAMALIEFAIAIRILAKAVKVLGEMDPNQLTAGLIGVSVLLGEMVGVAHGLTELKGLPAAAFGLLILSAAIKVLTSVVKELGSLNIDQLKQGLVGLVVVLGSVVAAAQGLTELKGLPAAAFGLLILSAAIKVLTSVVKDLSSLSFEELLKGLGGLIVVMGSLVLSASALDNIDVAKFLGTVIGLTAFVGIVKSIAEVATQLGSIPFKQLVKGLGGLAAILIGLAAAAVIFSSEAMNPAKIQGVGNALVVFSVSIGIMAASLKLLSTIPWQALLVSLGAIVGMFVIIGVATAVLSPLVPAMMALAGAFALFGVAALAFGAGVALAAVGLATLVTALAAGGLALAEVGRQFLDLIRQAGEAFANMFVGFVTTLAEQGPVLIEAISQIIQTILTAIMENVPMITQTLLALLTELLNQLVTYVPQMANAALQIITGFLQAIAENLPQILEAALTIGVEFINGITQKLPEIIDAAFKLLISFIEGLAKAIDENHNALFDAIGHLIKSIIDAILDGIPKVLEGGAELLKKLIDSFGNFVGNMMEAGKNLIQGFIDGILSMGGALWDSACNLADQAWQAITGTLDEHSPSRLTFGGGVNFVQGFINGMEHLRSGAISEAGAVAYGAISAFEAGLDNADTNFAPTYTPVIDSTEIQNGIHGITGMMDSLPSTYGITADLSSQNKLKNQMMELMSSAQDYSSIVGSIDRLHNDMANYTEAVNNMQIVMDNGTLVGQLSPGIDMNIGREAILTRRGV